MHAHAFSKRAVELIEAAGGTAVRLGGGPAVAEPGRSRRPRRSAKPPKAEAAEPEPEATEPEAEPEPAEPETDADARVGVLQNLLNAWKTPGASQEAALHGGDAGDLPVRLATSRRRASTPTRCRRRSRTRAASSACCRCSPAAGSSRLGVFALGIMPYITASIILQVMTPVFPSLQALQKEGELGQRRITQYTRYLTVVLAGAAGARLHVRVPLERARRRARPAAWSTSTSAT